MEGVIKKVRSSPLRENTLKASLTSYAILPTQVTFELAKTLDFMAISHLALTFGLFPGDCPIPLFLPKTDFEIGVRFFVTTFITSIYRELEVQLNIQNLCCKIVQARLAIVGRHYNDFINIPNFVLFNIRQISYCGLVVRDCLLESVHRILDIAILADNNLNNTGNDGI